MEEVVIKKKLRLVGILWALPTNLLEIAVGYMIQYHSIGFGSLEQNNSVLVHVHTGRTAGRALGMPGAPRSARSKYFTVGPRILSYWGWGARKITFLAPVLTIH
jgi:hypothetical protein